MKRRELLSSSLSAVVAITCPPPAINRRPSVNWAGRDLRLCSLKEADLRGADLRGCRLDGVDLTRCDLRETRLDEASLLNVTLAGARLSGAQMRGVRLSGNAFYANASGVDFRGTRLEEINFSHSDLSEADFREAHLQATVDLSGARLCRANLSQLADPFRTASDAQPLWLTAHDANLDEADLTGITAQFFAIGASFRGARLAHACFGYSRGPDSFVRGCWFSISGADFTNADLTDADLRGGAEDGRGGCPRFDGANLTRARLTYETGYPPTRPRFAELAPLFAGATLTSAEINGELVSAL
jgi:uncharacterized protein YjbI with pentapeptide repeats